MLQLFLDHASKWTRERSDQPFSQALKRIKEIIHNIQDVTLPRTGLRETTIGGLRPLVTPSKEAFWVCSGCVDLAQKKSDSVCDKCVLSHTDASWLLHRQQISQTSTATVHRHGHVNGLEIQIATPARASFNQVSRPSSNARSDFNDTSMDVSDGGSCLWQTQPSSAKLKTLRKLPRVLLNGNLGGKLFFGDEEVYVCLWICIYIRTKHIFACNLWMCIRVHMHNTQICKRTCIRARTQFLTYTYIHTFTYTYMIRLHTNEKAKVCLYTHIST